MRIIKKYIIKKKKNTLKFSSIYDSENNFFQTKIIPPPFFSTLQFYQLISNLLFQAKAINKSQSKFYLRNNHLEC